MTLPSSKVARPHGSVALLAGATSALGEAIAHRLHAQGCAVGLLTRGNPAAAQRLAAELGDSGLPVQADAADTTAVRTAVRTVAERFGPVDVLVNAAHTGMVSKVAVADCNEVVLERQLSAVTMHARFVSAVVPDMRHQKFGRIIYISGALMARPAAGYGAFAAAKAAATALTRHVALEEGRHGITANIIAPGPIRLTDHQLPLGAAAQLAEQLLSRSALGAFPTNEEVAAIAGYLAGPLTGAITGQTIWMTGGEPIM